MPDFQGDRCETCRYLFRDEGKTSVCRRYPPTVMVFESKRLSGNVGDGLTGLAFTSQAVFPPMLPSAWCGEHKAIA